MRDHPWNIFFLVAFIIYVTIRGVWKERVKRNVMSMRRVDGLEKALMTIVIPGGLLLPLGYLFTSWFAFADYHLPPFAPWCGAALIIAGLWLFWRSHSDLGRNWSQSLEVRKDHELIRHGVYRSIRHPMYASIWVWCLGQGLVLENWLAGWYALAAFALMYFIRTPREERMMCESFGQQYRDYMNRTGRLFPRRNL
jgi:protein-S-isoprenylcysteine O-methyltransferase Ste14